MRRLDYLSKQSLQAITTTINTATVYHYIRVEESATASLQHLINIADLSVLLVDLTKF